MKNQVLLKNRLMAIASRKLGKVFISLFVMGIISSLFALISFGGMMLADEIKNPWLSVAANFACLFAGSVLMFLIQGGFSIMLLRFVRSEYATIGYLFYGLKRFKKIGPVAIFFAGGFTVISLAVRVAGAGIKKLFPDFVQTVASLTGENGTFYIMCFVLVMLVIAFSYSFVFLFQVRFDNQEKSFFWCLKFSLFLSAGKFFSFVRFFISAGARNLILASFYFGMTLYFSGDEESAVYDLLSMVFDFLYFINLYKAVSLMSLSVAVFYQELIQPSINIVISLKKDDDNPPVEGQSDIEE